MSHLDNLLETLETAEAALKQLSEEIAAYGTLMRLRDRLTTRDVSDIELPVLSWTVLVNDKPVEIRTDLANLPPGIALTVIESMGAVHGPYLVDALQRLEDTVCKLRDVIKPSNFGGEPACQETTPETHENNG